MSERSPALIPTETPAEAERGRRHDRAQLEAVLNAVGDGLWLVTEDAVHVNAAARRLLALPDGDPPDPRVFQPRDLDGTPIELESYPLVKARTAGEPMRFRARATRLDGVERVFDGTAAPIVADTGEEIGAVAVFRDITEEHNTEVLTKQFLERLFDALPTAVAVTDPVTNELLSVNPAFCELIGYEEREVIGREPPFPWWASVPEELASRDWSAPDCSRAVEVLYRRRDGQLLPVELVRLMVLDAAGVPVAELCLGTDLSERRRFEQQLLVSGKLATIGELAAGVAHEINNPLFAILGLVEFLLKDTDPDTKAYERLGLIQQTGLEIKEIVRALLDFARERSDEQSVVSLEDVVAQTVELVRRTSAAKRVEIVETYCDEQTFVNASANQLKQIFLNLLANARQAMPDGGTVRIEVEREGDWVLATVADTGPGIPEHVLPRIFEPFFTTKRALGGTGLGLSVSLGIAQMHGGELLVRSTPGEGATFVLRLPAHTEEGL